MLRAPITLTTDTLLTAIRWRHAEPHPVLADIPTWYDDAALRALDKQTREELDQHTLTSGNRLDPDFDDMLGAIIRPDRELYGWISTTIADQPRGYTVLAGVAYHEGFVIVCEHAANMVMLWSVSPVELLDSFIACLPPERPAEQPTITVPYADFLAATARTPREGFDGFRKPHHPHVRALQALFAQPRYGAGNLYAAARRRNGTRMRLPHPVNYIDTPTGRWLTGLTSRDGQRWATATPANSQVIAARLNKRMAALMAGERTRRQELRNLPTWHVAYHEHGTA